MTEDSNFTEKAEDERATIKGFGLCSGGSGGNPGVVDVRDGISGPWCQV